MLWFGGSVAEAVNLSKKRNAIFVVFIAGDNEQSTEMAATLEEAEITKRLSDEQNFLAIKLASGSTDYVHFAQMYQFVPVPSLFFIGRSGVPLEVVCAGVQAEGLAARVERILEEHKKSNPSTTAPNIQPSTSSQSIKQQTASLLQSEAASGASGATTVEARSAPKVENSGATSGEARSASTVEARGAPSEPPKEGLTRPREEDSEASGPAPKVQKTEEYEVVCDGDVCVRVPKSNPGPSSAPTPAPEPAKPASSYDADEEIKKLERAKELIEIRRREKADKEKELEKQKELERRATGQGVGELRRWQEEQEMRSIQEERKREKLENSLARQRILEQIAQDRAERRARELPAPPPPPAPAPAQPAPAPTGGDAALARLQFKLPDGGALLAQFPAGDSLAAVRAHLVDNLSLNKNSFTLWTAFPRRELVDDTMTLRELELAPSAALLVVSRPTVVSSASASPVAIFAFLSTFFSTLVLEPSYQLYAWLRARLFPGVGRGPPGAAGGPGAAGAARGAGAAGGARRRVGNVHRLAGDADDDNNTWNGNSTQQM